VAESIILEPGSRDWEEWRRRCTVPEPGRFSALYFLCENVLDLGDAIPMRPFTHYSLCMFAERATGIPEIDSARIQLIHVPRDTGKTSLITSGRTIQRLLQTNGWRAGIAAETQTMASIFLGSMKTQFEENEVLKALFPEICWTNPRRESSKWAADEIVLRRARPNPFPSILAVGVGGTRTGVHLNEWIIDDMLSQDLAENAIRGLYTEIDALNRWIPRLTPMLDQLMTDPMTFIGTPWYPGDSYDFVLRHFGGIPVDVEDTLGYIEERGWSRLWQLTLPSGERQTMKLYRIGDIAYYRRPAIENGQSIFPEKYSVDWLQKEAARPGNAWFIQAQFHLEPTGVGATEFDGEHLRSYDIDWSVLNPGSFTITFTRPTGEPVELPSSALTFLMAVDPAFGTDVRSSRTAIPVVALWEDCIFLIDDFAGHGVGTFDLANLVCDSYSRFRPVKIFMETIGAQAGLIEPIQRTALETIGTRLPIEEIRSQKRAKELRVYALNHYFKSGRFYVPRGGCTRFRDEHASFPIGLYRDILDALTFMIEEWEKIFTMSGKGGRKAAVMAAHARRLETFRRGMKGLRGYRRRGT